MLLPWWWPSHNDILHVASSTRCVTYSTTAMTSSMVEASYDSGTLATTCNRVMVEVAVVI
jgi:hypothetical protein